MPPSGLRSMALRRQLLASFLVEYSSESGPAPFEKNVLLRLHEAFHKTGGQGQFHAIFMKTIRKRPDVQPLGLGIRPLLLI
ncbi:Uncharacterised protein [Bifidobacterium catenulatum]|nr:Uncharacterised protein [Bifidobacterium catenulatum]